MFSSWFDVPRQQLQAKYHFGKWAILVFICWLALLHTKVNWKLLRLIWVMMNSCNPLHSSPHSTSFWQSSTQTKTAGNVSVVKQYCQPWHGCIWDGFTESLTEAQSLRRNVQIRRVAAQCNGRSWLREFTWTAVTWEVHLTQIGGTTHRKMYLLHQTTVVADFCLTWGWQYWLR